MNRGICINKKKLMYLVIQVSMIIGTYFCSEILKVHGLEYLEIVVLVQFIFSIIASRYIFGDFRNLMSFFLGTLCIFNFGRIILEIFNLGNYGEITWFAYYTVTPEIKLKVVLAMIYTIQGLTLGFLIIKKKSNHINKFTIAYDSNYFYIGKKIFIIFGILNFIRILIMIIFTMQNGYMDYYSSGLALPMILGIADDLFRYSFYLIVMSNPSWEKVKKYAMVYGIFQIGTVMTGFRGQAMVEIVSLILYITYKNKKAISLKKLSIGIISLIVILFISGDMRMGQSVAENFKERNVIVDFINEQGYSLNVLSGSIENRGGNMEGNIEYLMYPFKQVFNKKKDGNGMLQGVYDKSLAHSISYYMNQDIYYTGGGMGGNYIAELYIAGGNIFIFIFNFIMAVSLYILYKKIFINRYFLYIYMFIIPYIFIMPREYTFVWILSVGRMIMYIVFIVVLRRYLRRINIKNENNNMCKLSRNRIKCNN